MQRHAQYAPLNIRSLIFFLSGALPSSKPSYPLMMLPIVDELPCSVLWMYSLSASQIRFSTCRNRFKMSDSSSVSSLNSALYPLPASLLSLFGALALEDAAPLGVLLPSCLGVLRPLGDEAA